MDALFRILRMLLEARAWIESVFETLNNALLEARAWIDAHPDILLDLLLGIIKSLLAALIVAFAGFILRRLWMRLRKQEKFKPPFNIPRLPPRPLRGRVEEQEVIKARLLEKNGPIPVAAITGKFGVGKTTLAIWIAHDVKRKFQDGVAWVTWQSLQGQEMLVLLRLLGVLFHEDRVLKCEDAPVCAQYVCNVLYGKRALIVLDDVPEDRVKELEILLPPPKQCAALVTSRGKGVPGVEPGGEKELEVLDVEGPDALALLEDALGENRVKHEEQAARQICRLVEGHPLALTIAAGLLADKSNKLSLKAYAEMLEKERLDRLEDRKKPEGKESSVRYSAALSYNLLTKENQKRFRLLAMLESPELCTKVVAALWGATAEREAEKGLDMLARRSLVDRIDEQRWRLHILLRLFGEECLQREEEERIAAGGRLAEYYVKYVKLNNREEGYLELDADWANLQHAMHWAKEAQKDEATVQLALETRAYFDKRVWWKVKRDWLREGVKAARRLWSQQLLEGVESARRLRIQQLLEGLDDLGAVCIAHGPYAEARDCYQEMYSLCMEVGDLRKQARALQQLGEAETLLGRYSKAHEAYNKALALCKERWEWWAQEAQIKEGIGHVLLFQREYAKAKKEYEVALDLWERLGERKSQVSAQCNLGNVARMEEKNSEALERYSKAIELYDQLEFKWSDSVGLGDVHYGRGEIARRAGQNDQAWDSYWIAVYLYHKSEYELGQAQVWEGLGLLMQAKGNYRWACDYYEKAFQMFGDLEYWPGEARVAHQLGEVAYIENKYALAQEWYDRAFELYRDKGVEEPWRRAETAFKAGEVARLQGQYRKARQMYDDAKKLFEQQENKRREADVQYGLGYIARVEGNAREARERLNDALGFYKELDSSQDQAKVLIALCEAAELEGKHSEAIERYQAASVLYEKLDDNMGQAKALLGLGRLGEERYQREGNLDYREQAHQFYRNAYRRYESAGRLYEETHDQLGQAQVSIGLGKVAWLKNEGQAARSHLEAALALCSGLGVRLEEAQALQLLGEVARLEGEDLEAKECLGAALALYEQIGAIQGQAQVLVALGEIEQLEEQYPIAKRYMRKAIDRCHKQELHAQEALVHLALEELEITAQQSKLAEAHYKRAIDLYQLIKDQVGEAQALRALARLYKDGNLVRFATERYAEALTIMDDIEGLVGEQIWQELTPMLEEFKKLEEFEGWQKMWERELEKWHGRWG
jgi:tetratricopeptide (TPR) repeat protein